MKKFYKSKTLWVNLGLTAIFGIEQFTKTGYINPENAVFFITFANLLLRFITKDKLEV